MSMSVSGARFLFGILLIGLNLSAYAIIEHSGSGPAAKRGATYLGGRCALRGAPGIPGCLGRGSGPVAVLGPCLQLSGSFADSDCLRSSLMTFVSGPVRDMPLAAVSCNVPSSLTTPLLIAAVAAWSPYVIVMSRPSTTPRLASESAV